MENRVRHLFGASIENRITAADLLSETIAHAAMCLTQCLLNNGKFLIGGHGGSAANSAHFSIALLNYFEIERPSLPVIALSHDYVFDHSGKGEFIFSRQIHALGQTGDILILLTTSGHCESLIHAVHAAHEREMQVIVLTGTTDGAGVLIQHLKTQDIVLKVPGDTAALVRETHLFILHCFCDLIEQSLFGQLLES